MQGIYHSPQARKIELGTDDEQSGGSRATIEWWLNAHSTSTIETTDATESGPKSLLRASIILPVDMHFCGGIALFPTPKDVYPIKSRVPYVRKIRHGTLVTPIDGLQTSSCGIQVLSCFTQQNISFVSHSQYVRRHT